MIQFADRVNFHGRNFPALFRAIESARLPVRYYEFGDRGLKRAFGDYSKDRRAIAEHRSELERLALPALATHRHHGVPLYEVCKYELLHRLMLEPRWYDVARPNDPEAVFDAIARLDPEALLDNCAAAAFWVDYWRCNVRPDERPVIVIFGNSLSYTRSLTLQAEHLHVTPVVVEHFFTGYDHYLDVRRTPIQGYNELRLPMNGVVADRTLVLRRLAEMKNKNVTQASFRRAPTSATKTALVLGQVVNDFAAIAPHNPQLGTVAIYKQLCRQLVQKTDLRVVVKTHPYESHKTNGRGAVTREELRAFVAAEGLGARVRIVEAEPLRGLFESCELAITLHSQAALEALARGLPVATLGDPFYASHGFTHDFRSVDELCDAIADGTVGVLSNEEQERYFAFMTRAFEVLVHRDDSPHEVLARLTSLGVRADHAALPGAGEPGFASELRRKLGDTILARKARKLVRDPRRFFEDAVTNAKRRLP